ncbi:MAG: hypothetical protein IPM12_13800 [Flavobacteriales bacterium]|nr:hypothetical protein [Flavobacteriales bacterium]
MLYEFRISGPGLSELVPLKSPAELGIEEKHIEDFVAGHLDEVVPQDHLMLIAQERKGGEEADIFALDQNGVLFIFELKRWRSNKENLLQVLRYGQIFGRYEYEELEDLAKKRNQLKGSLREAHKIYFELEAPLDESQFNKDQVFVVVTNGMDQDTLEAISYWSKKGLRIDSLTYKLYKIEDRPFIYFNVYNPLKEAIPEVGRGIYVVNTNASFQPEAWRDMLGTPKASAYYDRKMAVAKIAKGSTVYLYHTGVGVIAKGKTTGAYSFSDVGNDKDEECYVPLRLEWSIMDQSQWSKYAVPAYSINRSLGTGHRFRQSVWTATPEVAKEIDRLHAMIASQDEDALSQR